MINPHQEVSQKLGVSDVVASSSRTQLKCSGTFGLANRHNLSLSLSANLGKKKALQYQAFKNKPDMLLVNIIILYPFFDACIGVIYSVVIGDAGDHCAIEGGDGGTAAADDDFLFILWWYLLGCAVFIILSVADHVVAGVIYSVVSGEFLVIFVVLLVTSLALFLVIIVVLLVPLLAVSLVKI